MTPKKATRFLVRRSTNEVFVWTETLANRNDLEEVWAESAKSALSLDSMPDPRSLSLDELERMGKDKLIMFAKVKLGLDLDADKKKDVLLDEVKLAVFMRPSPEGEEVAVAKQETRPMLPQQARSAAGA
jgi:hypothetical protein